MNETSKAMRRRFIEDQAQAFPWMEIFNGKGVDVGCGPDKLPFDGCQGFDKEQGDANLLTNYFPRNSLDYVHASQVLEHMMDPYRALSEWLECVKVGGHVIVTIPDWCLYEHMIWPSKFNPDHRTTWSLWLKDSYAPMHIYLPTFLVAFSTRSDVRRCKLVDTNYNYKLPPSVDQTWKEEDGVEAFIEFVLRKNP